MSRKVRQRQQQQLQQRPVAPSEPSASERLAARVGVSVERFSGPLPPPEVLEKYNQIEPGFANRIMTMAENQARHRQSLERIVIESRARSEQRAQILGTILALVIGVGGMGLVYTGHGVEGVVTLVGELAALAGVFVYGRRRQEKENAEKREALARGE